MVLGMEMGVVARTKEAVSSNEVGLTDSPVCVCGVSEVCDGSDHGGQVIRVCLKVWIYLV
jgi:hypothetical protein